jgi:hypothetical protein
MKSAFKQRLSSKFKKNCLKISGVSFSVVKQEQPELYHFATVRTGTVALLYVPAPALVSVPGIKMSQTWV